MVDVPVRELRNNTRKVLERARSGETVVITVDGRPEAELRPVAGRPTFLERRSFITAVGAGADAGLTGDLVELAPDSTDDLPW